MDRERGQGMNKERIEEEIKLKNRIKELREEKKTVREIMEILNISTGKKLLQEIQGKTRERFNTE